VLISALSLAMVHLLPSSGQAVGLILAALVPGYLLTLVLYPSSRDLGSPGRALAGIGLSALLALTIGLALSLTPRGLRAEPLATLLFLLSLFLASAALLRQSSYPRRRRTRRTLARSGSLSRYAAALLALLSIGALAITMGPDRGGAELQVLWPEGKAGYMEAGSTITATAEVTGHGKGTTGYTLRLILDNSTLMSREIGLGPGDIWKGQLSGALECPPGERDLSILLFEKGAEEPIQVERIRINVSASRSSIQDLPVVNSTPPVPEERRIVVLGAGDDSDGGGSRRSALDHNSRRETQAAEQGVAEEVRVSGSAEPSYGDAGQGSGSEVLGQEDGGGAEEGEGPADAVDEVSPEVDAEGDSGAVSASEPSGPGLGPAQSTEGSGALSPSDDGAREDDASGSQDTSGSPKVGSETSEIGREIDSWVSTRGIGASRRQEGYQSRNIRYVRGSSGEMAVLGRSSAAPAPVSKEPVRLG
ncbi:MAG: DUF1616 domain-containing protein, partial [Methanothrix sp.]|nr:DUF1616 domain-containing protein [Methanothrix sp.]